MIRKAVAGSVLAAGLGVAGIVGAGAASADSGNANANGGTAIGSNPSISDTQGYGVVNHMQGDDGIHPDTYNGTENGIGWIRSGQTGTQVSAQSGTNRVVQADPNVVNFQVTDTGNKFSPGQTAKLAK